MKKITAFIAFVLILTVVRIDGTGVRRLTNAQANAGKPSSYSFSPIAFLDQPAPGGTNFTFDFEAGAINSSGEVAFTADVTDASGQTDVGEGVFVGFGGQLSQILRQGLPAPGGSTFGPVELGRLGLSDGGDVAIPFSLEPFDPNTVPFGFPSGLFRFLHSNQTLSAVVLPGAAMPGGGNLAGVYFNTDMNNRGDIVFTGYVTGADLDPNSLPGCNNLGIAVFQADKQNRLFSVVRPGDPAPGGGIFDMANNASINNGGDIAFGAHVEGEECVDVGGDCRCGESIYLKDGATGAIRSIAHQGDPAPGGGVFRLAFGGVVNSRGDIAFIGDLTPAPDVGLNLGVFLFSKGSLTAVARPGDAMPGGGHFVSAAFIDANYGFNQRSNVSFTATLDTDANNDGIPDNGLYVSSNGAVQLVARTGTVIPGLGTIAYLGLGTPDLFASGGVMNNRGQLLFSATLTDGTGVLLVATP